MSKDDNGELTDNAETKRYFAKFSRIISLLSAISEAERDSYADDYEADIIIDELRKLSNTFEALSMKYLFTGVVHNKLPKNLEIDTTDSGFPVFHEILQLENDAQRAQEEYESLPKFRVFKDDMIDHMLKYRTHPRELQFSMSQKSYYDLLMQRRMFVTRNAPTIIPMTNKKYDDPKKKNKRYLVHWSVYDSIKNYPNVYIMVLEDSARRFSENTLLDDPDALQKLKQVILNQSLSSLKMVTIAMNIDKDFEYLHPLSLKRIYIGPMYSNQYTHHNDNIQRVLKNASEGNDWVFAWTVETLMSQGTKTIKKGLFGDQLLQVYYVDKHDHESFKSGSTETEYHMVLPYESYQCLHEDPTNPLHGVFIKVVDNDGRILEL